MKLILGATARITARALLLGLGVVGCAAAPTKEVVSTKGAPDAIGPYSQGVRAGSLLFLSGQGAIDPKTNQMVAGAIEEQTKQVLENLQAVLKASGMSMEDIVSATVYLKDLNDFAKMNAVYATYFKDKPPARATVQVARIPRDGLVAISAIASK